MKGMENKSIEVICGETERRTARSIFGIYMGIIVTYKRIELK